MIPVLLETPPASFSQWAAVAIGLLTIIYVAFVRPLRKGRKRDPLARSANETSLAQQRAVERDMGALLVEYEQMMRRMTSQLETRVTKLQILIGDADERIAELRRLEAEPTAPRGQATSMTPLPSPVHAPMSPAPLAQPFTAPANPFTAPAQPVNTASRPVASPAPSESVRRRQSLVAAVVPSGHQSIYDLADQGLDANRIARRLDRPSGEIELILALRQRALAARSSDDDGPRATPAPTPAATAADDDLPGAPVERSPPAPRNAPGDRSPDAADTFSAFPAPRAEAARGGSPRRTAAPTDHPEPAGSSTRRADEASPPKPQPRDDSEPEADDQPPDDFDDQSGGGGVAGDRQTGEDDHDRAVATSDDKHGPNGGRQGETGVDRSQGSGEPGESARSGEDDRDSQPDSPAGDEEGGRPDPEASAGASIAVGIPPVVVPAAAVSAGGMPALPLKQAAGDRDGPPNLHRRPQRKSQKHRRRGR